MRTKPPIPRALFRLRIAYALLAAVLVALPVAHGVKHIVAFATFAPTNAVVQDVRVTMRQGKRRLLYEPVVAYRFRVDGTEYHGSRFRFGGSASRDQDEAREAIAGYRVGQQVTVYVDPQNPDRSFLTRGVDWALFVGAGVVLLLIGYVYRSEARRNVEEPSERSAAAP